MRNVRSAKNKTRYQNIPSRYQTRATAQHEAPSDLAFAPLGAPRCLLGNVIAIFDVDIGAFRLVGRLELELFLEPKELINVHKWGQIGLVR